MFNKKLFSIISLVLASFMLLFLAACNNNTGTSTADESTAGDTSTAITTAGESTATEASSSTAP
ncbi:MAG: hypothetical protein Q4B92_07320, partial [Ruminococcus sp.]|nr:hypothetical protein [Ruminococcus sp.]